MESSILALIWPIAWTYRGLTYLSKKKAVISFLKLRYKNGHNFIYINICTGVLL